MTSLPAYRVRPHHNRHNEITGYVVAKGEALQGNAVVVAYFAAEMRSKETARRLAEGFRDKLIRAEREAAFDSTFTSSTPPSPTSGTSK